MVVGFDLVLIAVIFTLLAYVGSRESRSVSKGEYFFRYQKTLLIAFALSGIFWAVGAVALLIFCFDLNRMIPRFLALYVAINCIVVSFYIYGFLWYKSYALEIGDGLILTTLRGRTCLRVDDIYKAQIIEGKDSVRMVIFTKTNKKITISGFLQEANVAFEKISNLLSSGGGCDLSRRSYSGHWTSM